MADLFTLQGVVSVDVSRGEAALRRMDNSARQSVRQLETLTQAAKRFGNEAQGIGRSLSVGVTLPLLGVGAAAVKSAIELDSMKRALTAVAGSAEAADRQLARLREISKLPGIDFVGAVQGATRLQAVGVKAADAERALKAFANAVATTGGSPEQFREITVQLGQLSGKGKLLAQDLRPIIEAAPAVAKVLKDSFGSVDPEVLSKKLEKLGLDSKQFIGLLVREMEKMPQVSAGARESFDNLAVSAKLALAEIGKPILRTVIPAIERLIPVVESAANSFSKLSPAAQDAVLGTAALSLAVGPVTSTMANATIVATGLAKALSAISGSALAARAALAGGFLVTITTAVLQSGDNANPKYREEADKRERNARAAAGLPIAGLPVASPENEGGPDATYGVGRLRTPAEEKTAREQRLAMERLKRLGNIGTGDKKKQLTEAQELAKQLAEVNKEIAYLTKSTSQEFKLKVAIDGAQAFQKQVEELLQLQGELGLKPGVPTIQYGKAKTIDSRAMAQQLESLREIKSRPEQDPFGGIAKNQSYEVALEAESMRLEEQKKLLDSQARIADTLSDAAENLRDKLATIGEGSTEENAAKRKLRGLNVGLDSEQGREVIGLARQVDAQEKYRDAMEKSREATERFTERLKDAFQSTVERLLKGDAKGALGGLKNYGIGLASQGITNALFPSGGGLSPAFAGAGGSYGGGFATPSFNPNSGGGGGGGFGGYARQSLGGGNGILNTALGLFNKGAGTARGGWDAATAAEKVGGAVGKSGGFLSKLGGLFGLGGGGAQGATGALAGLSSALPFIGLGISIGLPLLMKAFGHDYAKDIQGLIGSEYGVKVSKEFAKGVVQTGQSKFGPEFPKREAETVRLPEVRESIYEWASAHGIKGNSKLFSAALLQDPYSKMNLMHRANGGPVSAGRGYVWNETPGEVFIPSGNGFILNRNQAENAVRGGGSGGGGSRGGSRSDDRLAQAVMALVSKLQVRSADQVVMLARHETVAGKVRENYERRGAESERIRVIERKR